MWSRAKADGHGVNARVAIIIPAVLGSMPFFWICCLLSLLSLPAVLSAFSSEVLHISLGFPSVLIKVSLIALIAWIAQTFIQLVALPVLQVSNNAQMEQVETGLTVITDHTTQAAEALNLKTQGGLQVLDGKLDKLLEAQGSSSGIPAPSPENP